MASWNERAFDIVTEITKQVLTLSAAIVALTITFLKDFASSAGPVPKTILAISWIVYFISIIFGLMTLMASAGLQADASSNNDEPSINAGNLRLLGGIQLISFLLAVLMTIGAGIFAAPHI